MKFKFFVLLMGNSIVFNLASLVEVNNVNLLLLRYFVLNDLKLHEKCHSLTNYKMPIFHFEERILHLKSISNC